MSPQRPRFSPVRIPRGSELLAQRVRAAILVGDLPVGSTLPSENELVQQFGVSRSTVREGLRLLEADGLISTRPGRRRGRAGDETGWPGRRGGATVSRPSASAHTRSLALLLQLGGATLGELLEARRALKPYCGRVAAQRIRPAELAEMRAILAELRQLTGDAEAFHRAQIRFHLLIAQGTRNAVLNIYCTSIAELIYDQIREVPFTPQDLEAGAAACARILEALERGDGEAAERRIARHLAAVEATIVRRGQPLDQRPTGLTEFVTRHSDGAGRGPQWVEALP